MRDVDSILEGGERPSFSTVSFLGKDVKTYMLFSSWQEDTQY